MEQIINNDPTLKMIIDAEIDYKLLDHQVNIKCAAIRIAYHKYIDRFFN